MKIARLVLICIIAGLLLPIAIAQSIDEKAPHIVARVTDSCEDGLIQARIQTLYNTNFALNNFNIGVIARDGEVTLSGALQNNYQKDLAELIAGNTEGVRAVTDNIIIDPRTQQGEKPFGVFQKISDATSTALIKTAIIANSNLKSSTINVMTINGIVTLKGSVNSIKEKQLAAKIAANTIGVSTVKNYLEVNM